MTTSAASLLDHLASADAPAARRAAALLGAESPWVACATLLAAAEIALTARRQPWALLDAAERVIGDLRLEYGCEEWATADWSRREVLDLSELADLCGELRRQTRLRRDAAALQAESKLRRVG